MDDAFVTDLAYYNGQFGVAGIFEGDLFHRIGYTFESVMAGLEHIEIQNRIIQDLISSDFGWMNGDDVPEGICLEDVPANLSPP